MHPPLGNPGSAAGTRKLLQTQLLPEPNEGLTVGQGVERSLFCQEVLKKFHKVKEIWVLVPEWFNFNFVFFSSKSLV